jgi:putative aldouronate transport system substrate-binding protein
VSESETGGNNVAESETVRNMFSTSLSRRALVQQITASAGVAALLSACGLPGALGRPTGATATANPVPSGAASSLKLPVSVPVQGPPPDKPGGADGILPPLYVNLPKNLVKSVSQPPGKGGTVVKMTSVTAAQIPLEQNTTWQEVNRQLNVNLKLLVYTVGDYPVKLSTVVASGDLPDMFTVQTAVFPQFVQFLESSCADLTPYLAGDAIRDYPNLANYPAYTWRNAVFNGKIYGLSAPAGTYLGYGLLTKQPYMDQAGVKMGDIKSADDFLRAAKLLTIPGKRWALGGGTNLGNPVTIFKQVFGAPNIWRNDGGKLTRDIETAEYRAAVAYCRTLWDAGVVYPNLPNMDGVASSTAFYNSSYLMYMGQLSSFGSSNWARAALNDPASVPCGLVLPFSADGKTKPIHHLGTGAGTLVVFKRATTDRIKEMLTISNFLASPFGTQEHALLNYGVNGVDYSLDENGNPVQNKQGAANVPSIPPWNIGVPLVLYYPQALDAGPAVYSWLQQILPVAIQSPVMGLYSSTDAAKGGLLNQQIKDGVENIIYGRDDISSLDQVISTWRAGGGDQMRTEYEQALQDSTR